MEKYIDEEDLLGFHVFLAELELLMGNNYNEVQFPELLQKLYLSIDHTDPQVVKDYQRRGEQALVSLLLRGQCREARELICICLSKLYIIGDRLPIFAQVNSLQGFLLSKDAFTKKISDKVKLGVFSCLCLLCCDHGAALTSSLPSLISVGVKHASRSATSVEMRVASLKLVSSAIRALGNDQRHGVLSQVEGLKLAERNLKGTNVEEVKICGLQIICSVCRAGGGALWVQNGAPFEEIFKLVLTGLQDSTAGLQSIFSEVLGELLAVLKSPVLQEAIEKESKEVKKQNLIKLSNRTFAESLTSAFVETAILNKKSQCIALAKSWVHCMSALSVHASVEEQDLVQYSTELISILSKFQTPQSDLKSRTLMETSMELGSGLATGEHPIAQACILYALRTGIFTKLSESGQRRLTDQLGVLLASVLGKSVSIAVCSLEGIRVLLGFLGEVSPETASDLGITFMEKLTSSSAAIRSQSAAALGSLVHVDPACAATMITSSTEFLKNSVEQLISLSAPYGAMHPLPLTSLETISASSPEEASRKDPESAIRGTMHAVYGYATGLASLIVAASSSELSVPLKLYQEAFEFAKELILNPKSKLANSWAIEMKAGYCVLGALCVASLPQEVIQGKKQIQFLELWEPALGATAQAILMNRTLQKTGKELDLALQLWWRSEALLALEAFMRSAFPLPKDSISKILSLICPILEGLVSNFNLGDPRQIQGGPGGWIASTLAYLQFHLLKIFQLLPDPHSFAEQYPLLIKLCSQPFSCSSYFTGTASNAVSSVLLRNSLNSGDQVLGPWVLEEGPIEEKLNLMTGEKGAPHYAGWEAGMFVWGVEQISSTKQITLFPEFEPILFPQYTSLAVALIQTQLSLFGKILSQVSGKNRVQLMDNLLDAIKRAKNAKNQQFQEALLSSISVVLLSSTQNKLRSGPSPEIAQKTVECSTAILETAPKPSIDIIRASAEILSLAGVLGGDGFSLKLLNKLITDLKSTPLANSSQQNFLLLSIGCLFRSKGGMCLQNSLPQLITTLFGLIQNPGNTGLYWTLHCLCLSSTAAGLTFLPYVKTTLGLLEKLMMSDVDDNGRLRPFIGRLTNSMVALLGPELLPGSTTYNSCKCLMRQMRGMESEISLFFSHSGVLPGALEQVLYAQQLILFAPQAVPAEKHIGMLLDALASVHPSLRFNASITLRHLTERDPEAICKQRIEKQLFHALDMESEVHISTALHSTLEALQLALCPTKASVWLDVCASIVLVNPREVRSGQKGGPSHKDGSLMEDLDEAEGEEEENSGESKIPGPALDSHRTPRLKTRIFACGCLLRIFESVGIDRRHFDLIQARQDPSSEGQEFLVSSLSEIVKLGFSLSTGPVEALQPEGIKLLDSVILHFGHAEDPDVEKTKLLFQFQAQFVSPLRQALSPAAPPLLFMAGSTLAVSFLRSGLGGTDAIVLKQLIGLLVEPIQNWNQLHYRNFSEWVSVSVKVSLLEAHAHCTVLAETKEDPFCSEIVHHAQEPIFESLKQLWMALLTDLMVLNKPQLWSSYHPSVICFDKMIQNHEQELNPVNYEQTWPIILKALSLHLPSSREILSGSKEAKIRDPSSTSLGMKSLRSDSQNLMDCDLADFYWRLLDLATVHLGGSSIKLIEQAKSEDGLNEEQNQLNIDPLCICLSVLKTLLAEDYTSMSLCPVDVFQELLEMILSILQQVIHPIVCALTEGQSSHLQKLNSVIYSITEVLVEVGSGLKNESLHQEHFTFVFMDCLLGCGSLLTPSKEVQIMPGNPQDLNKGLENCLNGMKLMMESLSWELIKEGANSLLQYLLNLLKESEIGDTVVSLVCELVLEVIKKSPEEQDHPEPEISQSTASNLETVIWVSTSILEIAKSLISQNPVESTEQQENSLSQISSMVMLLLQLSSQTKLQEDTNGLKTSIFEFLSTGLDLTQSKETQQSILKPLKSFLQDSGMDNSPERILFTSHCIVELSPKVAALAHEKIPSKSLDSVDLQVIAEALKVFIVALQLPCMKDKENVIFQILIPLLVEAMECVNSESVRQMSMKLIRHLSSTQVSFKTAVNNLPMELKQRFQKGIQTTMESDQSRVQPSTTTFVSRTSSDQKPTIVLKNFALK